MNRRELCDQIAAQTGVPVSQVDTVITGLTYVIPAAVKKGDRVGLVGFGTWEPVQRNARKGRNPRTGQTVRIKARKVPVFRAGIPFKDAVAGGRLAKPAALQTSVRRPAAATRVRAGGGTGRASTGTRSRSSAAPTARSNSTGRRKR